jgi:AmmeMemoRadiSam system protein A
MNKPTEVHLIKYATSGQMLGDYSNSVSYLGIVFAGNWQTNTPVEADRLSEKEKQELLKLARQTIIYYLKNKKVPEPQELGITIDEKMKEQRAAFVTLKERSMLRGCIGDIFPRQPLYKSVISNAINASTKDPRFLPVNIVECNDITIEISALTVPHPVSSPDNIRIGTDGIILSKGERSAVFLPQVAPEQGWGLQETLSNLSMKAGLPANAWKENATFQVFEAEVFGEEK